MRRIFLFLFLLSLFGCERKEVDECVDLVRPIIIDGVVEFRVNQRARVAIPGSDEKLFLSLEDITLDQVLVSLLWDDGRVVFLSRSFEQDDVEVFSISDYVYKLKLKKLVNLLVGDDYGLFELCADDGEGDEVVLEDEMIELLISSLRELEGARFVRNDKEYSVDEAIAHMQKKWEW